MSMRPEPRRPDPDCEEDEVGDREHRADLEHELVVVILAGIALILRLFWTSSPIRRVLSWILRSDLKAVPVNDLRGD
jgi:hypothetical protein